MRRRTTYIYPPSYDFNPADLTLHSNRLTHSGVPAALEDRLTFALDTLPPTLSLVLRQSHELHIRWVSQQPYDAITPYLSTLPSGLHVHYTPLNERSQYRSSLCVLLQEAFKADLKCFTPASSFTRPELVSERFASAASLQFYEVVPGLERLVEYARRNLCAAGEEGRECHEKAELLREANYLDLDYDSISHALVVTAFWSKPPTLSSGQTDGARSTSTWSVDISSEVNDKVEVGFLAGSAADDANDLKLGGFLVVVGEDEAAKPTLFSFPSRHHRLSAVESRNQAFHTSFREPTGLHPILTLSFPSAASLSPPESKSEACVCALHAYLTLPSGIFIDQYAFPTSDPDPLFQQANNIVSLRAVSGELDLEAPDYVVEQWGSTVLFELAAPDASSIKPESWEVTIPTHLRFQSPSNTSHFDIQVPWPTVFWACTAEEGTKFLTNPFDRTNLGYDGLFGSRTMFYHVNPISAADRLVEDIPVPVLNTQKVGGNGFVEFGTVIVVLLGFVWVVIKLWPGIVRRLSQFGTSNAKHISDRSTKSQSAKKSW